MMINLSKNESLSGNVEVILRLGVGVLSIFSVILLFYTNSFLMKRRQKEIGVYNILGMEKRHIGKMLTIETLLVLAVSMVGGLVSGIILSRLMYMILRKLLIYNIHFEYELSLSAVITTILLFLILFAVTLFYNLIQIKLSNPIGLLQAGKEGEKEPKTRWLMTVVGVVCLGIGYYIAITTKSPLAVLTLFFVAVLLVILGTYALFTAGSITLIKTLKKNKNFYYKTKHFSAVSGLLYRMKQNAAGLANICILSTAVLVMVSTTVSLYIGMEDEMENRYPRPVNYSIKSVKEETITQVDEAVNAMAKEKGLVIQDEKRYCSDSLVGHMKGNKFISADENTSTKDISFMALIPLEDYNKIEGASESLKDDEVIIYTPGKEYKEDTLQVNGKLFHVVKSLKDMKSDKEGNEYAGDYHLVFLKDKAAIIEASGNENLDYTRGFSFSGGSKEKIKKVEKELENMLQTQYDDIRTDIRSAMEVAFIETYGSLFFIGCYLGFMFLVATVLIIYYKQISEGFDDKERFHIMQKVGMSKKEVKESIKSQILIVFFIPLITAVIHVAAAFPLITRLLAVLNLTNILLFVVVTIITVIIFAIIYVIVYLITAREYYNIVN